MGSMLVYGLVIIAYIIGLIASIAVIIHAFQEGGALQGILCLFIPIYLPIYMFLYYDTDKRGLVIAGVLIGVMAAVGAQVLLPSEPDFSSLMNQ